jgi:hypothetical protein
MRLAEDQIDTYLYPLVAVSKLAASYSEKGLDPSFSLLLGFAKKDTWRSESGRVTAPDLHGMSGCGTWWLKDYTGARLSRPLLDAIAIEWHTGNRPAILSTRVHRVVHDLALLHPETHEEVKRWRDSA